MPDHVTILVGSDLQQRAASTVARRFGWYPALDVMQDETGTGRYWWRQARFRQYRTGVHLWPGGESRTPLKRHIAVDGNLSYAQPHRRYKRHGHRRFDTLARQPRRTSHPGMNSMCICNSPMEHARAHPDTRDDMTAYTTADLAIEWQAAQPLILHSGIAQPGRHAWRHDPAPADTMSMTSRRGRAVVGLAYQSSV